MTDEELTALYNEANGITGKRLPITTQRIFTAMRAAILAEREACAKVCDEQAYEWRGANTQIVACAKSIRMRSNG